MKKIILLTFCLLFAVSVFAQSDSAEFVKKAWEAQGKREFDKVFEITSRCIELFQEEADSQAMSLNQMPEGSDVKAYEVLNNVATCYFIQAEALMRQEQLEEAKEKFKLVVDNYPFSQAWDPRGWYWSVAKVAQESIDKINNRLKDKNEDIYSLKEPIPIIKIDLHDAGIDEPIDYKKYGEFKNVGTKDYTYIIKDQEGLSVACGEGVYPNTSSVKWNPLFVEYRRAGKLGGSVWDFVHSKDLQAAFFKWASSTEPMGTKLFYTASILEKSGLIKQAIKAYYSIIVHFPSSYGWTYWHTPWYLGEAAIYKIKYLLRTHPEINWELKDAKIQIINGFDNNVANDIAIVNPGILQKQKNKFSFKKALKDVMSKFNKKIIQKRGEGKVRLVQYEDGQWQMLVDDKPYMIKAITYAPTPVGESPDEGTMTNWMEYDSNDNGKIDGPFDAYVDTDKNKTPIGDFQLMKEMGVNTIRLYHHPLKINKELLRTLYNDYGIRVILGDFLGKYAIGSGASWSEGTDYANPEHQENMLKSVIDMVKEYKDEPFVLYWLLGNENVYGLACNADKDPESFFKFANEVALEIKKIDKEHPVGICSGDTLYLDIFAKNCPDIDIFGTNSYRGNFGFGGLWEYVKDYADIPAIITEYGCPAYGKNLTGEEAESFQADYHKGTWEDIVINSEVDPGFGNAIGGVVFQYLDEWWKAYEPYVHDKKGLFTGPFPDGYMHEEWLGVCGQGKGDDSPFLRHLRKAYFYYKKAWR